MRGAFSCHRACPEWAQRRHSGERRQHRVKGGTGPIGSPGRARGGPAKTAPAWSPVHGRERSMPRTIAEQTVEELGGRDSVLARQRRDHVQMDRMMDEYQVL